MQYALVGASPDGDEKRLHELVNMLLMVMAHADFAGDTLEEDHPSRCHIERVKAAAHTAARLVHELSEAELAETPSGPEQATHQSHASRLIDLDPGPEFPKRCPKKSVRGAGVF